MNMVWCGARCPSSEIKTVVFCINMRSEVQKINFGFVTVDYFQDEVIFSSCSFSLFKNRRFVKI